VSAPSSSQPLRSGRCSVHRFDVIQVDVAVVDKTAARSKASPAADFTLLENGKPKEVAAFAEVIGAGAIGVACGLAARRPTRACVPTN
jgi:hypothetical protein